MPNSSAANKNRNNSKSDDASKLIRENMKCPVCLEVLLPPIYQCETGHNICYLCVDEVSECPLCKSDYGDTRNYFAEELVNSMTFPCKYEEYGCHKTFLGSQLKDHQENCECQPYRCPELACQEVVGIHQMSRHLDKHGFKVMKGDVHQASLEILDDHFDRKTEYNPWRISAFNAEFYTVSTRSRDGLWFFWTYGLGTQKDLRKFSYEIVLFSEDKQFMYRGVVQSLRSTPEDIMKGGNCLITSDTVIKSIRKNGRIKCQVYVIKGKNWDSVRQDIQPITNRGKLRAQGAKGVANKGKRLIPNTGKFTSSTVQSTQQQSIARLSQSRLGVNSTINKRSNQDVGKKDQNANNMTPTGGSSRCNSATNKVSVGSGKVKELKVFRKRSRSRSLLSVVRKRSEVSEAENKFVQKIKETLRCPGCNEVIVPPVYQCMIGHNVCHKCKSARQDCPLCRAPLGESRNFFAEELLYKTFQRCVYAKHGCKVCLPSAQMKSHETVCDFAPFECPFNVCRALLSADDMYEHLQTHQISVVEKELKADVHVPRNSPTVPVCTIPNILKVEKVAFYPIIVRDTDGSWLFYVITHHNASYRFELMIKKQHKTLAFQGPVLSLRANHSQAKLKGLALIVSEKSIKSFKSSDKISYHVKISKLEGTEEVGARKSAFPAPMSWIIVPKTGEVLSKAELYANKKTSVSPEDDSEEDDDTRSIPQHTVTDTVYYTEPEETDSANSDNDISSIGSEQELTTVSNVPGEDSESEVEEAPSVASGSGSSKRSKKKQKPPPTTTSQRPGSETKPTDSIKPDAEVAKESVPAADEGSVASVTPVVLKTEELDPNNNLEVKAIAVPETQWRVITPTSNESSKDTDHLPDINNNNNTRLEELCEKAARKALRKTKESLDDFTSAVQASLKESAHKVTSSTSANSSASHKSRPPTANKDRLASPKPDKSCRQSKRWRSASGHRVRMSDEVVCCGGCTESTSGTNSTVYQFKRPSSRSQLNLHSSKSVGRVSSLGGAASKHALANNLIDSAEAHDDIIEEQDLITAKSLSEMGDAVNHVVNSVISLFTSSSEKPEDSIENLDS